MSTTIPSTSANYPQRLPGFLRLRRLLSTTCQAPAGNVVLEFKPNGLKEMGVACVWSRWAAPGQPTLLSFAATTDEPPPEVPAAGHDRRIIPVKPDNVMDWLTPEKSGLAAMYAILDDKDQPYEEHRLAA